MCNYRTITDRQNKNPSRQKGSTSKKNDIRSLNPSWSFALIPSLEKIENTDAGHAQKPGFGLKPG